MKLPPMKKPVVIPHERRHVIEMKGRFVDGEELTFVAGGDTIHQAITQAIRILQTLGKGIKREEKAEKKARR